MNAIAPGASRTSAWLAAYGDWLRDHARVVRAVQWIVVAAYAFLLVVPALMPLPGDEARAFSNLAVFAQWAFWGLWWPFVILSMFVAGRTWCGLLCPEGTLTETASRIGLHRPLPRWLRWAGWPFLAFVGTTLFGQLVSVYQYAPAALVVLGGSTLAAIGVGLVYGREKRVWCRHLCPVSGVFSVLARVAPVHFRIDGDAWSRNAGHVTVHPVNCAPLVRIRRMAGPSECHMCGRCSGHLDAIALTFRPPNREVATLPSDRASRWDAALIVGGLIGIAVGAFHWSASPWFVQAKLAAAALVVEHGPAWLLADDAPWWLLTHYPEANEVFTWLDGAMIVGYILATAAVVSSLVWGSLVVAAGAYAGPRVARAVRLSYALIPLAGLGVFLGLSSLTVTLAKAEGVPLGAVPAIRALVLAAGAAWSLRLAWSQLSSAAERRARTRAFAAFACGVAVVVAAWALLFFRWS